MTDAWFFDDDGWTKYPLFHGTSSFFLPSIKEHGLGGRNPMAEFRALPMYRELYALRKRGTPVAYERGGTWGYGDVYLTAYERLAESYSGRSELLALIRADLSRMNWSKRAEFVAGYPEVVNYIKFRHKPIILRLPRMHVSQLLGWYEDDPCGESMGRFDNYQRSLVDGSPTPAFRLREATHDFEVIEHNKKLWSPPRWATHPDKRSPPRKPPIPKAPAARDPRKLELPSWFGDHMRHGIRNEIWHAPEWLPEYSDVMRRAVTEVTAELGGKLFVVDRELHGNLQLYQTFYEARKVGSVLFVDNVLTDEMAQHISWVSDEIYNGHLEWGSMRKIALPREFNFHGHVIATTSTEMLQRRNDRNGNTLKGRVTSSDVSRFLVERADA